MQSHTENYISPKHPHEPEIPPTLDSEGRCLVCGLLCQIDKITADCMEEQRRTNITRASLSQALKDIVRCVDVMEGLLSVINFATPEEVSEWSGKASTLIRELK